MQSTFFTDEIEAEFGLKRAFIHQNDYGQEFRKLNSMALFDLSKSYVPTRLENCTLLASSFGVDYVWPLLDSRLMQQWLSTPTLWKIGDGWMGRYLHRCAVDGVCPSKVTWKPDKNMGFKAIHGHFEQRCNRDLFSSLLGMAEGLPAWLESVVDVSRLKRMASNGIKDDSRGYQLHSALIMLDMNLRSLTAWEDV
jgi:asparagine synthase (glutamine-hydrolysing)